MSKIKKPSFNWQEKLSGDLLTRGFNAGEMNKLIKKAQKEYLYWDTFKYQPIPEGFTPEEAWTLLKLNRSSGQQRTPVTSTAGQRFTFSMPDSLHQKLNFIDTHASSFLKNTKLSEAEENKFIITGFTEEAIATSQIEGANTSRKVAKEMLASQRKPRTKDEQMIINSYRVMQKLSNWKELDLSKEMLLEIQSMVTDKTLTEENDQGRFRTDEDSIVVKDPLLDEIVYTPPNTEMMFLELEKLLLFANATDEHEEEDFIHPVIKAAILHFWVAYLHPFPDGNGRTARAIFYWYLLKKHYWLIEYLSVSRAIINSRKKYDDVYIYAENENDLTYFLLYIAEAFKTSIEKFVIYVKEKLVEREELKKIAIKLEEYNPRQIALLKYFLGHEHETIDVSLHQTKHGVSRQTAHNDLMELFHKGLLAQTTKGKRFIFMPKMSSIKKTLDI